MNISTETREILRNYKTVINARRREMGQKPLTTAQIVDEICDFVTNQQAVFTRAVTISFRAAETGDTGQAVEAACQPRKPRQADACRKQATLTRRPLPFPSVMCLTGMFFLMELFFVVPCLLLLVLFCGFSVCPSFGSPAAWRHPVVPTPTGLLAHLPVSADPLARFRAVARSDA